jgi:hypothetical protein
MPWSRSNAEYSASPLGAGPQRRRRHWLRTAQLNIRGWSALLGACAAAGAAGVLLARALGLSGWLGLILALVPVGAAVVADRRRWAAMETSYGWSGSVAEVAQIAEELRGQGVDAEVRPDPLYEQPWWDRIGSPSDAPDEPTASLVHTNRHEATVRAVLRAHGVDLPDPW